MTQIKAIFPSDLPLLVEVFHQHGDPPFVSGLQGRTNGDMISLIEKDLENEPELLNKGDGLYLFTPTWIEPQIGEFGRVELPGYWLLDFVAYRPL